MTQTLHILDRAGNGWAVGAEGSGRERRGWACIGRALDCFNDSLHILDKGRERLGDGR